MCVHVPTGKHVELRGQLLGVVSFFFFFFCHVGPRDGTQGAGVVAGVFIHGAILLALILLYCINDLLKSQGNAQDKGSL